MKVQSAQIIKYATSSGPWTADRLAIPTFAEIEAALRRLDGDLFPSVSLYFDSDPAEDSMPDFDILGGNEGFYVEATVDGTRYCYFDGSAPDVRVAVWLSDQGAEFSARRVCPKLEAVIAAAKHFCETGQLLPSFPWHPTGPQVE